MDQASTSSEVISRYILLNDIVASSRLMEQYPLEFNALLDRHNQLFLTTCGDYGGEIFKNTGDGYYVFFVSFNECVAYAHELAKQFAEFPTIGADEKFQVGIAIHAGEIRPSVTQYFGPALNRASRLCSICNPGQILISGKAIPYDAILPEGVTLTDLGLHHLRDLGQPEHLFQLCSQDLAQTKFPALETLDNRPNNLFEQPNAFIGREAELAQLTGLLDDHRLISIIAPGGYGKSRLAAHLCADLLPAFDNGVFFIELASVRDHKGITTAIANATGFHFFGNREPEQQIVDFLRNKEMLLCLDNFEHVLEGSSLIGDILKEASMVKIIVTSREPLRITGEQKYPLEPLPVEGPVRTDKWDMGAVILFTDRASMVNPAFTLDVNNISGVYSICQRLDGVPLAIELAAAWMDNFSLEELLAQLDEQLELTARLTDLPERHHSLRASLDWSWNLLSEEQQLMLMRISTFRGGCFPEAASAVTQMKGMKLRGALARLIDKGWLYTRNIEGQTRFYLRDAATREYAFEKLGKTREKGANSIYEQAVMEHAQYFSELIKLEGERLHGHGQLEAFQRFCLEKQNIYEALDTLLNRLKQADISEQLVKSLLYITRWLWEFLDVTSDYLELVHRYQVFKDATGQATGQQQIQFWARLGCARGQCRLGNFDAARSDLNAATAHFEVMGDRYAQALSLGILGIVETMQGNFDEARGLFNESLAIKREIGDHFGIAVSLTNLGIVEYSQANYDAALRLHNESLTIRREIGDLHGISSVLNNLGIVEYSQGNLDAAQRLHYESLDIMREIGDRYGNAVSLNNLGIVERMQGNYDAAGELVNGSLAIFREIGDREGTAMSLINLGVVEYSLGNLDAAREPFVESLSINHKIGNRDGIAMSLINLGILEYSQGNYSAAREQYSESLAIKREIANPISICESTASIGCLLVTISGSTPVSEGGDIKSTCAEVGVICLYGARHHATQLNFTLDPMEGNLLEEGLAIIEHPDSGLPPAERERLKAQAEAMTLDELAGCALEALEKLKPVQRASGSGGNDH